MRVAGASPVRAAGVRSAGGAWGSWPGRQSYHRVTKGSSGYVRPKNSRWPTTRIEGPCIGGPDAGGLVMQLSGLVAETERMERLFELLDGLDGGMRTSNVSRNLPSYNLLAIVGC